jgi:copper chaperone
MSCEHCVKAITGSLKNMPGVSAVAIDLSAKTVTVEHDSSLVAIEKISSEIENQGYNIIDQ